MASRLRSQALGALGHAVAFVLEGGDHLRGGIAEVDGARLVEAGQDLLDDPGRQAGVEQSPDLPDPVHVASSYSR